MTGGVNGNSSVLFVVEHAASGKELTVTVSEQDRPGSIELDSLVSLVEAALSADGNFKLESRRVYVNTIEVTRF